MGKKKCVCVFWFTAGLGLWFKVGLGTIGKIYRDGVWSRTCTLSPEQNLQSKHCEKLWHDKERENAFCFYCCPRLGEFPLE